MEKAKLFDLSTLEELGDPRYVLEIVNMFLDTTPSLIGELSAGAEATHWEHIRATAHKLRSSMGVFGSQEGVGLLRQMEELAKGDKNSARMQDLLQGVISVFSRMEAQLKIYIIHSSL